MEREELSLPWYISECLLSLIGVMDFETMIIVLYSRRIALSFCMFTLFAVSSVGWADDEIFFQYAIAARKAPDPGDPPGNGNGIQESRRLQCFAALAKLRNERETFNLLKKWPQADESSQQARLVDCWENGLYWAGLCWSEQSKISLKIKLESMAGLKNVLPEKVISQLIALESDPIAKIDQEKIALLRFATRYDKACKSRFPDSEFAKLVPIAINFAPQLLHLNETIVFPESTYPGQYFPFELEIEQCSLAILSIVPPDRHTNAIKYLFKQDVSFKGLGCSNRGWRLAFETGLDLWNERGNEELDVLGLDVLVWRSALLENLSVDLQNTDKRLYASEVEHPNLDYWRTQLNALVEVLRSRSYREKPEALLPFLQEPDDRLWRFHILLSLESARVLADQKLLTLVSDEFLTHSERIYNPDSTNFENSDQDLIKLYLSAYQAALRVEDKALQKVCFSRLISIGPNTTGGSYFNYNGELNEFDTGTSVWVRFVINGSRDRAAIKQIKHCFLSIQKEEGITFAEWQPIGVLWALNGSSKSEAMDLLKLCDEEIERSDFFYGVGFTIGDGRSLITVSEALMILREAADGTITTNCMASFCNGYTNARQDPQKAWTASLVQILGSPRLRIVK